MRVLIWAQADERVFEMKGFSNVKNELCELFIEDFPSRPHEGDLINLMDIIGEDQLTENQKEIVYGLTFSVDYCCWEKDEKGIYLKVHCKGE